MSTAQQIVEAEIGPQDDLDQFIRDAIPDFLMPRFELDRSTIGKPFAYDSKTGTVVCYFWTKWTVGGVVWSINIADTAEMYRRAFSMDPKFTPNEINALGNTYFPSWKQALEFFLQFEAARTFIKMFIGDEDTDMRVPPVEERLQSLTQALADRGFITHQVAPRKNKGTACYVVGETEDKTAEEVTKTLQQAAKRSGLRVENVQAAMPTDRTWQIDFNAVNLYETDMDEFVTTAFINYVPGYAEIERLDRFKHALRAVGLPVYKMDVQQFQNFKDEPVHVNVRGYWDNSVTNYSRRKSSVMAVKAAKEVGYDTGAAVTGGHGYGRYIEFIAAGTGVPMDKHKHEITEEAMDDEADFAEYAEIAAAQGGTVGDELRLTRLVRNLKKLGIHCKEGSLSQFYTMAGNFLHTYTVEYTIRYIRANRLPLDDNVARSALQQIITKLLNDDREISGAEVQPQSDVLVRGGHDKADGFSVHITSTSLRKPSTTSPDSLDKIRMTFESEPDDFDEYAAVAINGIPGLRTRMWLKAMRETLKSQGFTVRHISAVQWDYKLRVYAHINAYSDESGKHYQPDPLMAAWRGAVMSTGNQIIVDHGEWPTITGDRPQGHPMVYTIKCFVGQLEPPSVLRLNSKLEESFSIDDFEIDQHEIVASVMGKIAQLSQERQAGDVDVVWGSIGPTPKSELTINAGQYKTQVAELQLQIVCWSVGDAMWALTKALDELGYKLAYDESGYYGGINDYPSKKIGSWVTVKLSAVVELPELKLERKSVFPGPDYEKWKKYLSLGENLSPEDEYWLNKFLDTLPGVRDLERMKNIGRMLEANGYKLSGMTQGPLISRQHAVENGNRTLMLKLSFERIGDVSKKADSHRIYNIITQGYEVTNIAVDYDTTDGKYRVMEVRLLSYDAPEDIQTYTLRSGRWNEQVAWIHRGIQEEMFLVEQFDAPGEEELADFFASYSDEADPIWRERARLDSIAQDIRAAGWKGRIYLQGYSSSVNKPVLWICVWRKIMHGPDVPVNLEDRASFIALLDVLNDKYHFTSPYGIRDAKRSVIWTPVAERPADRSAGVTWGFDVGVGEYIWADPSAKDRVAQFRIGKPETQVTLNIGESIEWTPRDMAGFMQVAATPDRLAVANAAFQAFIDKFDEQFPNAPGHATFWQQPKAGGKALFDCTVTFVDKELAFILDNDRREQVKLENEFREAVLQSGLKRYFPRRTLYFKWPHTEVEVRAPIITIRTHFLIANLQVQDKARHYRNPHNLAENLEDIDMDEFIKGAGIEDEGRIAAMMNQWAQFSDYIKGGHVDVYPTELKGRRGKYGVDMVIRVLAKYNRDDYVYSRLNKIQVEQELLDLLARHGFGDFVFHGTGWGTMNMIVLHVQQQWGWSIYLKGARVAVPHVEPMHFYFGAVNMGESQIDLTGGIDPEEFMAQADAKEPYRLRANLKEIAKRLADKGWVGTMLARGGWYGSRTCHSLQFYMRNPTLEAAGRSLKTPARVSAVVAGAVRGFPREGETGRIETTLERRGLPGFPDLPGYYYWKSTIPMIGLEGRGEYYIYTYTVDIQSGSMSVASSSY